MITGAVLAGGKSLRFGKNKAFQLLRGKRFIDLVIESLRPFCDPVMAVVSEIEPYLDTGVMLAQDVIQHRGPLGGLYTALLFSPAEWVFVRATDTPFLVPELASMIIDAKEGFDAVVPKINEFYDPLLALYNRRCIPAIARQLREPDNRQVIGFYRKIRIRTLTEREWRKVDPDALSFKNVNTPADLAGIDGLERS
ncbi:Molybdenum cofactor guanylyltransferase [Syntrophobacter sp. SbD2]|nr:Molybdenum cofactor guanylyltransferase [Syntrophobacter sp. SbD2]